MEKVIQIENEKIREMIQAAVEAQKKAYAPYSRFYVGAALLCKSGEIFTGCNIENASYPAGNCAERTAVFKAVSEGNTAFSAICIVGGPEGRHEDFCPPCGICRQVLTEFCDPESFLVILAKGTEEYRCYTLEKLFPLSFGSRFL